MEFRLLYSNLFIKASLSMAVAKLDYGDIL